ncbi:MAG TPA: hypothetical protein DD400_02590 [Rhodospirillaceae bacterium]|nr:hypothetical protein [Rhodospirillaceae bacterium]
MTAQTIIPPTSGKEIDIKEMPYGAFMDRFIALLIDQIILFIVKIVLILPAIGVLLFLVGVVATPMLAVGTAFAPSYWALLVALDWFYFAAFESSERGATLGKRAMKLRVVDEAGKQLSFGRASVRYFSKILSAFPLLLGYIMALFTKKKQALHDLIAGTVVTTT